MTFDKVLLTLGIWTAASTAVLLLAWLTTRFIKRNAAVRHLIWVAAFTATLLAPVTAVLMPAPVVVKVPVYMDAPEPEPVALATEQRPLPPPRSPIPGLLAVWIVGTSAVVLQAALALNGVRHVHRRSVEGDTETTGFSRLAAQVKVRRQPRLRVSETSQPPSAMTWGVSKPVVLLPQESSSWSERRLRAVLLHELAHVRRLDCLSQLISIFACAFYWFNPVVWACARAMRAEAETAADDAVLRSGVRPTDYAAELLSLAAELGRRRQPLTSIGVSVMKRSGIEKRVKSIVDPANQRSGLNSNHVVSIALCGLVAAFLLTCVRPSVDMKQKAADMMWEQALYAIRARNQEIERNRATRSSLADQAELAEMGVRPGKTPATKFPHFTAAKLRRSPRYTLVSQPALVHRPVVRLPHPVNRQPKATRIVPAAQPAETQFADRNTDVPDNDESDAVNEDDNFQTNTLTADGHTISFHVPAKKWSTDMKAIGLRWEGRAFARGPKPLFGPSVVMPIGPAGQSHAAARDSAWKATLDMKLQKQAAELESQLADPKGAFQSKLHKNINEQYERNAVEIHRSNMIRDRQQRVLARQSRILDQNRLQQEERDRQKHQQEEQQREREQQKRQAFLAQQQERLNREAEQRNEFQQKRLEKLQEARDRQMEKVRRDLERAHRQVQEGLERSRDRLKEHQSGQKKEKNP
ncbi:MAG TPA: M56 family metallopeptidase [Fimbriimonas sp.]|nr:M56 family metallopeptidase [Fimbriimonas sp.]